MGNLQNHMQDQKPCMQYWMSAEIMNLKREKNPQTYGCYEDYHDWYVDKWKFPKLLLFQVKNETFNSLAPGNFKWNFRHVIFKQILVIDGWGISCEIALMWMSLAFTDDQSILSQEMAWCWQATSHYLSQCWPRSMSPYGVTRPQWVNDM